MPYPSGHVELEQLSAMKEDFNYPTVSEGGGERHNNNANVYVDSADDHACDSHISLTSGATPIPEEIARASRVLQTDTALMNMVSQFKCNILCAIT